MTFTGLSIGTMAALLVGSAVLLAALHWLRIRPQTVWVNTTLFWNQALRRTRARSLWERFRHPLTYLLLLLIAVLLVVALAGPRPLRDSTKQEHTVFVLDLNSSMSTDAAEGATRFDLAKEKLTELVDQSAWPEKFAVVTAGAEPRLIHAMGDLRPMLEHRLETVKTASVPTDRKHAVRLAASLLEGRQNPHVCLLTDRPFEEANQDSEQGPICQVVQVGQPVSNAAILSAIFEPDPTNPLVGTLRVRAGVWPKEKAVVKLTVQREGGAVLKETEEPFYAVEDKSTPTIELEVKQLAADGGIVIVKVSGDDALSADSEVRYRLPVRQPIRLLVEGDVPDWLTILMKLDPTLKQSDSSDADVKLRVAASEPLPEPAPVVVEASQVNHIATGDQPVTFEDLYCQAGIPQDHFDGSITPLVMVGDHLLLASQATASCPTLWMADVAWNNETNVNRSAAWPCVVSRAIRKMAGWETSPMSLDPMTIQEMPELGEEKLAAIPGNRTSSNLTAVKETETTTATASFFTNGNAWVEWLLVIAFVLVVIEIILHTKGRIA